MEITVFGIRIDDLRWVLLDYEVHNVRVERVAELLRENAKLKERVELLETRFTAPFSIKRDS